MYHFEQPPVPPLAHKVAALAERLGVDPQTTSSFGITIAGPSGEQYDLIELINALLDRMDEAMQDEQ